MNDTWAKAQLEQMSNALGRILSDVEKFEAELADFRLYMIAARIARESKPVDPLDKFERSYGAAIAAQLATDINAAIMHPGESWQEEEE